MAKEGYLKPKVGDPSMIRKMRNGQAMNPPIYMDKGMGGFTSAAKLKGDSQSVMGMEKGGPQAKRGKPL